MYIRSRAKISFAVSRASSMVIASKRAAVASRPRLQPERAAEPATRGQRSDRRDVHPLAREDLFRRLACVVDGDRVEARRLGLEAARAIEEDGRAGQPLQLVGVIEGSEHAPAMAALGFVQLL